MYSDQVALANFTQAPFGVCLVPPYYEQFQVGQKTRCRIHNLTHCFGAAEMDAERQSTLMLLGWGCGILGVWLLVLACFLAGSMRQTRLQESERGGHDVEMKE